MVYLFSELEPTISHTPVPLFVDNSGVVSMVFNPVEHQSNKHIRISCHHARELAEEKVIAPQRVATEDNLADLLTKPLGGVAFKALVDRFVSSTGFCSRGGVGLSGLGAHRATKNSCTDSR